MGGCHSKGGNPYSGSGDYRNNPLTEGTVLYDASPDITLDEDYYLNNLFSEIILGQPNSVTNTIPVTITMLDLDAETAAYIIYMKYFRPVFGTPAEKATMRAEMVQYNGSDITNRLVTHSTVGHITDDYTIELDDFDGLNGFFYDFTLHLQAAPNPSNLCVLKSSYSYGQGWYNSGGGNFMFSRTKQADNDAVEQFQFSQKYLLGIYTPTQLGIEYVPTTWGTTHNFYKTCVMEESALNIQSGAYNGVIQIKYIPSYWQVQPFNIHVYRTDGTLVGVYTLEDPWCPGNYWGGPLYLQKSQNYVFFFEKLLPNAGTILVEAW